MFYEKDYKGLFKNISISILVTLAVGVFVWNAMPKKEELVERVEPTKISYQDNEPVTAMDNISIPNVVSDAISGVVGISVLRINDEVLFGDNSQNIWGIGSGVIVSKDGYILTNQHVAMNDSKKMIVTFSDGTEKEGVRVWANEMLDLAIIKVDSDNLNVLKLGNSDDIKVGETTIAIGNPLGLQFQRTVTSGIVSALNRTIKLENDKGENYMEDLIQTDASINPGNSGGPLLNGRGEVIGINTVKVESAEGIGFAIPINIATPVINHFIEEGKFKEPYLGVFAYDKELIPYINKELKIEEGIIVVDVDKNGPAYKSGLKEGCIITKLDEQKVNTMLGLRSYLYTKKPNDTVAVTYRIDGKTKTVNIVLTEKNI